MTRFLVMAIAICALLLSSCRGNANNVILSSLNRSAKIQFLCADIELVGGNLFDVRQLLPAALCTSDTTFAPEVDAQFLGAVTQIQSGEVAVVNFTGNFILNTSRTIPGVTAVTVDEQPTGIQASPFEPSYTYVTSFSARSVQAIPTEQLLKGDSDLPTPDSQRFDAGPTDLAMHEKAETVAVKADDKVTGADSSVEYRYLYAAIPELGQVAQVQVTIDEDGAQTLGEPVPLDLGTYDCATVTQVTPPASDASDYNRICPAHVEGIDDPGARVIKTINTTEHCSEGPSPGPMPISLTIDHGADHGIDLGGGATKGTGDDSDDVLLVADANQPVIHRFQLGPGGATPLDPIITGVPVTEVDVTPLVPASADPSDTDATHRYVYGVSALDGSIFVVDYSEELDGAANPTFGAVLPVLAGISARANEENVESRDRVQFLFSNVRAIEVVSPLYNLEDANDDPDIVELKVPEDDICSSEDSNAFALAQSASNMRGVFLAVSLSNGTMFFLDIYDLNAPCRGGAGNIACTVAENGPDRFASIRRHRRRFGFTPATFIAIDGSPSLQFNSAPGRLDETTGNPASSDGPGLEFINCPEFMPPEGQRSSMSNVFGVPPTNSNDDGLICASSQAWSSFSQRWDATWEGLIPSSEGGLGLFADERLDGSTPGGTWFHAGDVPLCRVGVLGPQDADADLVESYVGDRLLITGELPPSTRYDPACEDFIELKEDIDDNPVWFPILQAFNHELQIGESENDRYTLDQVRTCFPQFTEYEIHTNDAYTVVGTETGFVHRVIPNADDECVLDATRPVLEGDVDTFLAGRAFEDRQFINPLVSFRIGPFPPVSNIQDSTVVLLNFNILNQFTSLVLPTSTSLRSLPSSMLFSPQQDQLFFVDFEAGVRRIVFSPLNIAQSFE